MTALLSSPEWRIRQSIGVARVQIANIDGSLEAILKASDEGLPIRLEQQAPWIIGELEAALSHVRRALTFGEAIQAMERAEEAEARPAGSYIPARAA
jgi:hypothetical protein